MPTAHGSPEAAAGSALPDRAWLYFDLAQFPIYLLPQLLLPPPAASHRSAKALKAIALPACGGRVRRRREGAPLR
jgi:hypothetical protein